MASGVHRWCCWPRLRRTPDLGPLPCGSPAGRWSSRTEWSLPRPRQPGRARLQRRGNVKFRHDTTPDSRQGFRRRMKPFWSGVFPAITTQMHRDGSLDLEGTAAHAEVLIRSGISGLIVLGSLGENQSLDAGEKQRVMAAMRRRWPGASPCSAGWPKTAWGRPCATCGRARHWGWTASW